MLLTKKSTQTEISIPSTLRIFGLFVGVWAILTVLTSTLAYLPGHPDFSLFTTYLSDIGDTAGWPQILFNSGTLIAAPLRFLMIWLVVVRLTQFGAGRRFAIAALSVAFVSVIGTILMTAVPYSVGPSVHKAGIPLYFLGIVILQSLIGVREWSLGGVPKILPALSFLMVVLYLIFATLVFLLEGGVVTRNTPVVWEWLAFFSSVVWVFAHSLLLGRQGLRS